MSEMVRINTLRGYEEILGLDRRAERPVLHRAVAAVGAFYTASRDKRIARLLATIVADAELPRDLRASAYINMLEVLSHPIEEFPVDLSDFDVERDARWKIVENAMQVHVDRISRSNAARHAVHWTLAFAIAYVIAWSATATIGISAVRMSYQLRLESPIPLDGAIRAIDGDAPAWSPCPFIIVVPKWRDGGHLLTLVDREEYWYSTYHSGNFFWAFGFHKKLSSRFIGAS
ncbi:MAG: hypothetical protein KF774_02485 [Planctomyces sp.]|nr:hypothetical protein [Planctomyces sp.]